MTKHSSNIPQPSTFTQALELIGCTGAIYLIYLTYGIYYEKITRQAYDGEHFKYSLFLTTLQCFSSAMWALILMSYESARRCYQLRHTSYESFHSRLINAIFDQVPKHQYLLIATTYSIGMLTSTASLNYLSYLIQALAKSSKLIPVMIGKMLRGHKYSYREYFHVVLITGGIVLFIVDPTKSGKNSEATSIIGILLVIFSLAMDAVTGPTQDAVNDKYKPTLSAMTFWINILPAFAFAFASFIFGEWNQAINFIIKHPSIRFEIIAYCVLAAIGQSIILLALFKFNSMTVTIITTTRKFISILASVFWFGHSLQLLQWFGVIMVFTGIGADSHLKYTNKRKAQHQYNKEQQDKQRLEIAAQKQQQEEEEEENENSDNDGKNNKNNIKNRKKSQTPKKSQKQTNNNNNDNAKNKNKNNSPSPPSTRSNSTSRTRKSTPTDSEEVVTKRVTRQTSASRKATASPVPEELSTPTRRSTRK